MVEHPLLVQSISDRSLMVDTLGYFLFQTVLDNWCDEGCGVYYPVSRMVHIKQSVAAA